MTTGMAFLFRELILKGHSRHRIIEEIFSQTNDEDETRESIAETLDVYLIDLAKQTYIFADKIVKESH